MSADVIAHSWRRLVAGQAVGVWGGLTAWAALAEYVLPGRGHALGAEIVEGKRTVLQYLLSPVQRVTDEEGRER